MSGEKTITHSYHTATIQLYTLTGNVLMLQEIFRNFREINGPVSTLQAIVPTSVQFETRREGGATNVSSRREGMKTKDALKCGLL